MKTIYISIILVIACFNTNLVSAAGFNSPLLEEKVKDKLTVFPNPLIDNGTLLFYSEENCEVAIEFYDLTGKKIKELKKEQIVAGEQQINFHTEGIKDGIYLCRVISTKWIKAIRIVIKH